MTIEQAFSRELVELIALPDETAASELNERMLAIERVEALRRRGFVERGIIAAEFERRKLYLTLGYASFGAWMRSGFMGSKSSIYEALADVKALEPDVPLAVLAGVTEKANIKALLQCSSAVRRDPEIQIAAQEQAPDAFVERLEADYPSQHIQRRVRVPFYVETSQRDAIEEGLAATMEAEGLKSREEALEFLCAAAIAEYGVAR